VVRKRGGVCEGEGFKEKGATQRGGEGGSHTRVRRIISNNNKILRRRNSRWTTSKLLKKKRRGTQLKGMRPGCTKFDCWEHFTRKGKKSLGGNTKIMSKTGNRGRNRGIQLAVGTIPQESGDRLRLGFHRGKGGGWNKWPSGDVT